jgi:hypothetical protein
VNGKSLRQLLDEQKRLSPDLTMHIGACVAAALDVAHVAGLVHRDIKPGNILITPDGRVLLTDFGIAKGLASADDDLTSDNIMMGTAKYLSPEQVRGRKLDGRADLYSLGLVLYECLAGRVPFLGETDADTALARLNRDPTDLARLRPTLPYGLAPLIHRLLARRPEDRFATGAQVRHELTRVASRVDDPTAGFTPTHGAPSRHNPSPTPTRGTPVIAGRTPPAVGGYTPVRSGRPAGAPVRPDRTPPTTARPRQQPNRMFEQRSRNSMILVGGLLLAALIVALVLWATVGRSESSAGLPKTTTPRTAPGEGTTAAPEPTGPIVALALFDPDGDGTEQSTQVGNADDGNPATSWATVCYADRFLGGKTGLGLVADLGAPRSGTFTADIGSAPYQVQVFASGAATSPTTVAGWGSPVKKFTADAPGTVSADVTGARWVAVVFNELGLDTTCRSNRFRGRISEVQFAPS